MSSDLCWVWAAGSSSFLFLRCCFTSIFVTQQIRDAFYIATHQAVRENGNMRIVDAGDGGRPRAEFMVLHEGRIKFHGTAAELLASPDAYLQRFLYRTLPPW